MNLAALALIRMLAGDALTRMDWITAAVVSALAIDAGLYVFSPGVSWYVGLSGVLHGLLAAAALVLLRVHPVLGAFLGGMMGGGSNISIIPWWTAVGGLLFATIIGVIAGYSPARRAMRLSALESLRNE